MSGPMPYVVTIGTIVQALEKIGADIDAGVSSVRVFRMVDGLREALADADQTIRLDIGLPDVITNGNYLVDPCPPPSDFPDDEC